MSPKGATRCSVAIGLVLALFGCGESVRHDPSDAPHVSDPRARPGQILLACGWQIRVEHHARAAAQVIGVEVEHARAVIGQAARLGIDLRQPLAVGRDGP